MGGPMSAAAPPQSTVGPAYVPLSQLATVETVMGPPMIKSEMGQLTGWVYVDTQGRDIGGYVDDAKAVVAREVKLPRGFQNS